MIWQVISTVGSIEIDPRPALGLHLPKEEILLKCRLSVAT